MTLRILTVGPSERAPYAGGIAALEDGVTYPLGDDRFALDHGADYFAFFDRLGEATYEIALDGDRVVAVSARVLRSKPVRCWYLCDLKVAREYRGQRIPTLFARHAFLKAYGRCRRGYGITMNEAHEAENRVVRLVRRLPLVPFRLASLDFYSFDAAEMQEARGIIARRRGPVSFLSHAGRKDLILASTGEPLPLLHVQFGPCADPSVAEPRAEHVHMLCTPSGDPLARDLEALGATPSATATLLQHGLSRVPPDFILTSDI